MRLMVEVRFGLPLTRLVAHAEAVFETLPWGVVANTERASAFANSLDKALQVRPPCSVLRRPHAGRTTPRGHENGHGFSLSSYNLSAIGDFATITFRNLFNSFRAGRNANNQLTVKFGERRVSFVMWSNERVVVVLCRSGSLRFVRPKRASDHAAIGQSQASFPMVVSYRRLSSFGIERVFSRGGLTPNGSHP
jgi:hypothetical protein